MGYADNLCKLLTPLGVYNLRPESFSGGEIQALGQAMDELFASQQEDLKQMLPWSTRGEGLTAYRQLLGLSLPLTDVQMWQEAICVLLGTRWYRPTSQMLTRTLYCLGVEAQVLTESGQDVAYVYLPKLPWPTEEMEVIRPVVEAVIPCQLEIVYQFHTTPWSAWLAKNWRDVDGKTWKAVLVG